MKHQALSSILLAAILICACSPKSSRTANDEEPAIPPIGFRAEDYRCEESKVKNGEAFTTLMSRLGLGASQSYQLAQICDTVFDVRKLRAGNIVKAYYDPDTLSNALQYVVYENDRIRSTVFRIKDSLAVWVWDKPIEIETKTADVTICNSLWNDMLQAGEFILHLKGNRCEEIPCGCTEIVEMTIQKCDIVAIEVESFHCQTVFELNIPHPFATVTSGLLGWRLPAGGLLMLSY